MNVPVCLLIVALLTFFAVGYRLDWFDLWVSDTELQVLKDRVRKAQAQAEEPVQGQDTSTLATDSEMKAPLGGSMSFPDIEEVAKPMPATVKS